MFQDAGICAENFDEELFIQLFYLSIYGGAEEVCSHGGEDSQIAGAVVYEGLTKCRCHEVRRASPLQQMV